MKKRSRAAMSIMPPGMTSVIYATNCMPMSINIGFPAGFTEDDRARVYEALRTIYEEVTDRSEP